MVRNGVAKALPDDQLQERLVTSVMAMLRDDNMLAAMQESARAMDRPDAAEAIAELLWQAARRYSARKAGAQL
jgi:UDP-N-acetylglucosamine:LPS N-acetylglucosamine transferase